MVDRGGERRDLGLVGLQLDPSLQTPADGDPLELLRQLLYAPDLAALYPVKHEEQSRNEGEQETQQPKDRHLHDLNASLEDLASSADHYGSSCRDADGLAKHNVAIGGSGCISPYLDAAMLGRLAENP
jgi:hypothetical protein